MSDEGRTTNPGAPRAGKKMPGGLQRRSAATPGKAHAIEELVTEAPLFDDGPLPLRVTPTVAGVDLAAWMAAHREWIEERLLRHGGILFRGFGVREEELGEVVTAAAGEAMRYEDHVTPRSHLHDRLYTSTDYPPDQTIESHHECAYAVTWPLKIIFFCAQPPDSGGATPITDGRRLLADLDPTLRRRFEAHGVMYVRNFGAGPGMKWQVAFGSEDLTQVEAHCRAIDVDLERRDGGRLRTRQVRPALAVHPKSGEQVWFNQALAFHVSSLDAETRRLLRAEMAEDELPKNAFYGDGTSIEDSVVEELRAAYRRATVRFDWQRGDVLLLDNMLTAHGREPFTGRRKIMVAMCEPWPPAGHREGMA